ncbi:MAG TPA: alpha/beta fold hydrolase [Thermoanaerobaculia bacterium]|nr:alpha/beta fold hydrolase [Thermoanaerobaculia bacterium]
MPHELLGDVGAAWPALRTPPPRLAAVFVHGWGGDFLETWFKKPTFRNPLKGLIEYLAEDAALPWRFFSVKHTGKAFEPAKIGDLAGTVQLFLDSYVADADAVVLIAHSLGGLACRRLILEQIERLSRHEMKIIGLLMYGTPNDGTSMAKAAGGVLHSATGDEMRTYSEALRDINARWLERIANGGNPARDFDDRAPLLCWNVVGTADRIVPTSSASHMALMGDVKTVAKGHLAMVKPLSDNDVPIKIARNFLAAAETRFTERARDYACDKLAADSRKAAASHPWVVTEEETIELTPLSGDRSLFSDAKSLYRSHVLTVRTGVACEPVLQVGARLATASYEPGVNVVFDCTIGDGVTENSVTEAIRSGAVTREQLKEVVSVERIEATHGTRNLPFAAQEVQARDGWYLLPFRCDSWPPGVNRVDRVEVEISSVIDIAMGWYTFYAPNTVTERLTVSFRSPFEIACLLHEPLRSNATFMKENDFINGAYLTKVRVDGPVAAGARMVFIFRRDDGSQ